MPPLVRANDDSPLHFPRIGAVRRARPPRPTPSYHPRRTPFNPHPHPPPPWLGLMIIRPYVRPYMVSLPSRARHASPLPIAHPTPLHTPGPRPRAHTILSPPPHLLQPTSPSVAPVPVVGANNHSPLRQMAGHIAPVSGEAGLAPTHHPFDGPAHAVGAIRLRRTSPWQVLLSPRRT